MGLIECQLDCAFFEFPDLVPGGAACIQDNWVVLMVGRRREVERGRLVIVNKNEESEKGVKRKGKEDLRG